MRKPLAYLYILFFLGVWIWLILSQPKMLVLLAIVLCLLSLLILLGFIWIYLYDAWSAFRYNRRLKKLLGDRTLSEVLETSPYEYGYVFQGDDGYRLWKKDCPTEFIFDRLLSRKEAVMWIVEQNNKFVD